MGWYVFGGKRITVLNRVILMVVRRGFPGAGAGGDAVATLISYHLII